MAAASTASSSASSVPIFNFLVEAPSDEEDEFEILGDVNDDDDDDLARTFTISIPSTYNYTLDLAPIGNAIGTLVIFGTCCITWNKIVGQIGW
jgi:hypothetical protein